MCVCVCSFFRCCHKTFSVAILSFDPPPRPELWQQVTFVTHVTKARCWGVLWQEQNQLSLAPIHTHPLTPPKREHHTHTHTMQRAVHHTARHQRMRAPCASAAAAAPQLLHQPLQHAPVPRAELPAAQCGSLAGGLLFQEGSSLQGVRSFHDASQSSCRRCRCCCRRR